MSWRDEEYTDMERGLQKEVNRLRNVVRALEEENEKLRQDINAGDSSVDTYNKAVDDFAKALKKEYGKYDIDEVLNSSYDYSYSIASYHLEEYVDAIAEHIKLN